MKFTRLETENIQLKADLTKVENRIQLIYDFAYQQSQTERPRFNNGGSSK